MVDSLDKPIALTETCKRCNKFYGDHRVSDDACPQEKYKSRHAGFLDDQKFGK